MQALYRNPSVSDDSLCLICFALAKASEDLEDFSAAFQFYAEGNALRKRQLGYDNAQEKKLFQRIKASHKDIAAHALEPEGVAPAAPIFIVGIPAPVQR